MSQELVTLVDPDDNVIGAAEKLHVHREGTLHRAFSIFVFDSGGNLLLQRRARGKYHSGGLWSNTCCGHPRPGEPTERAAARRLAEEMGFSCDLRFAFRVLYKADVGAAMFEHELDHVFVGRFDGSPQPAPGEVDDIRWISTRELRRMIDARPEDYTFWLKLLFDSDKWPLVDRIVSTSTPFV